MTGVAERLGLLSAGLPSGTPIALATWPLTQPYGWRPAAMPNFSKWPLSPPALARMRNRPSLPPATQGLPPPSQAQPYTPSPPPPPPPNATAQPAAAAPPQSRTGEGGGAGRRGGTKGFPFGEMAGPPAASRRAGRVLRLPPMDAEACYRAVQGREALRLPFHEPLDF